MRLHRLQPSLSTAQEQLVLLVVFTHMQQRSCMQLLLHALMQTVVCAGGCGASSHGGGGRGRGGRDGR
jgi:hypothetical protein